jgi:hypothetical protein
VKTQSPQSLQLDSTRRRNAAVANVANATLPFVPSWQSVGSTWSELASVATA